MTNVNIASIDQALREMEQIKDEWTSVWVRQMAKPILRDYPGRSTTGFYPVVVRKNRQPQPQDLL